MNATKLELAERLATGVTKRATLWNRSDINNFLRGQFGCVVLFLGHQVILTKTFVCRDGNFTPEIFPVRSLCATFAFEQEVSVDRLTKLGTDAYNTRRSKYD